MADVDVPVVAAAVDVDVAERRFGGAGGVVAADVEQAKDRLGAVPFLAEGGLGPLDGVARQFPVAVQPVRVADHDDDAVLAVAGRQVLGHLGGKVLGRHAHVVLAAFDLFFRAGGAGGVARGGGLHQMAVRRGAGLGVPPGRGQSLFHGLDQLFFAHPMPAERPCVAGPARSIAFCCKTCNWSRVMRDNSSAVRHGRLERFPGCTSLRMIQAPGVPFQGGIVSSRRRRAGRTRNAPD